MSSLLVTAAIMLTELLALGTALSLTAAVTSSKPHLTYTSELVRYINPVGLGRKDIVLYMQNEQCTTEIKQALLCDNYEPQGLRVRLSDAEAFPLLHVSDELSYVYIARRPNEHGHCLGWVDVHVEVWCKGLLSGSHTMGPVPAPYP